MPPPASLAQKAGVVVAARSLTTIIDAVTGLALFRLLPKEEAGVLTYLLIAYEVVRLFATLGYPDSVFYFFERVAPSARRTFAWRTCGRLALTGAGAAAALLALHPLAPLLLPNWSPEALADLRYYIPFVALLALLETPTWPTTNLLLALDRPRDAGVYEVLTSLMTLGVLLGPPLLGLPTRTIVYGLAAYGAARLALSAVWLARVLPAGGGALPAGLMREQTRFAIPLGFNSFAGRLSKRIGGLVVGFFFGAATQATYNAGAVEFPVLAVVSVAIGSVLISRYVAYEIEGRRDELIALWHRAIERTTLVVVPATVGVIALAPDLVPLLVGADYADAVLTFQVFNLGLLHRVTSYGSILQAFGDTRGILRITLFQLAANAAVAVPLVWTLGIEGAALASVLGHWVGLSLLLRRIGMHLKLPARRVLPLPFYARVLAGAAAAGGVAYALRATVADGLSPLAGLAFGAGVYAALFLGAGTAAGVLGADDWGRIGRMLGRRARASGSGAS